MHRALTLLWTCAAVSSPAAAEEAWNTVATGSVTVKTRSRAGTSVREVHAEGAIEAPARAVEQAILSSDRYASFMPYVKESRYLEGTSRDATYVVYTRLALPIVESRDFVVRSRVERRLSDDGTGEFHSEWEVDVGRLPERSNVVRLALNTGRWRVTPRDATSCWAVYEFAVDPGGFIPPFLADIGNQQGVPDTFRAVEKEARRLAAPAH